MLVLAVLLLPWRHAVWVMPYALAWGIAAIIGAAIFPLTPEVSKDTVALIGLSVSRDLANMMKGDLVYRRVAGITVFELSLPPPIARWLKPDEDHPQDIRQTAEIGPGSVP